MESTTAGAGSVGLGYPPHVLREYAVLADGERAALIGPRGNCSWLCVPGFADPAVIAGLIGAPGVYAVTPQETFVWGGYYEHRSLIWRNRWVCNAGIIECREALALPADPRRAVLLRQVVARDGAARVRVELDLRADFGRHGIDDLHRGNGAWTGRCGNLRFRWTGAEAARVHTKDGVETLVLDLEVPAGARHDLVLEIGPEELGDPVAPEPAWSATEQTWSARVPELPGLPGERDARHAVAVLQGLTGHTGGMVAATTTSLPERAREGRNYDYRYVWIRDQCYAGLAGGVAGVPDILDDAVRFVAARLLDHGDQLAPAYTAAGDPVPDQQRLDLPGYPGGEDLVGNHVNAQFQLDAFGEALQLFAAAAEQDRLDVHGWQAAEVAVAAVGSRWQEPDAGIWELDDRRWTHSRLACVAGLRAIARHCPAGGRAPDWLALADRILAATAASGVTSSGRWRRAFDDDRVDAALLLPGLRGAVPGNDPRHLATVRAVLDELTQDGYVYRFRHDARPLEDAEGAFLLCGFWMAQALFAQGRSVEAFRWFERTRAACGPPSLFTEEFDVGQRQLRGNLPQAFVHAELLHTAALLREGGS